jgi:hypothetical protein
MRIEADLLRGGADLVGVREHDIRTEGQRGADAFMWLVKTLCRPDEYCRVES